MSSSLVCLFCMTKFQDVMKVYQELSAAINCLSKVESFVISEINDYTKSFLPVIRIREKVRV